MTTYTKPTGNAGTMRIDDDGHDNVDLYLLGVNELVPEVPWAYTVNGVTTGWQSFRLEPNVAWQKLGTIWVGSTQTITLRLGASGNVKLGGPTNFAVDITRSGSVETPGTGYARILVDGVYKYAIAYVNDEGEWKQAQPWGKIAGKWGPAL